MYHTACMGHTAYMGQNGPSQICLRLPYLVHS